jgi:hypothetical protein
MQNPYALKIQVVPNEISPENLYTALATHYWNYSITVIKMNTITHFIISDRTYHITDWMNEWMNKWMNEWLNEWMNEWMKWMNDWLNDWMNEWLNDWMIEWLNDWMNDWTSLNE